MTILVRSKTNVRKTVKRLIDLAIAAIALTLLMPILLTVSLGIACCNGFPVLFRSRRTGLSGKTFTMVKFRTMTGAKDTDGHLLPDAQRITRLGKFLRRTSLDELPQLLNVLKGDMSFVGPRPLPVKYLSRYSEEQRARLEMKPGVTGWTQIHYVPGDRTWEEKLAQDVWYVRNWSLALDVKILLRTVPALFVRFESRPEGFTTSPEFTGRSTPTDTDP
jgi:lipopolysaccharide/colanic/teichoic acid biosynthesis glycosyltransferase